MSRVLIIEDHGVTTHALTRLIEELGATVHSARTIAEAKRQLEQHPWDCVVMDLLLHDGPARLLIPTLRAATASSPPDASSTSSTSSTSASRRPRIAIVSGSLDLLGPQAIAEFEADIIFQKPIRPDELLSWVRAQLPTTRDGNGNSPNLGQ
jgi:DNA-binding response OmpR family regulator